MDMENEVINEVETDTSENNSIDNNVLTFDELDFEYDADRQAKCIKYYTERLSMPYRLSSSIFRNRLLNASGCLCTTRDELMGLAMSKSGGIVSKSCTLLPRYGNPHPRYYETDTLSINSTGLANNGFWFYSKMGEVIRKNTNKPYIVSVAGIENGDNLKILEQIQENENIDFIELNLSCPNIIGKPQIGYDFQATDDLLNKVFEQRTPVSVPIGLKLPPYFDQVHFQSVAEIFDDYNISFLTCVNSLGNGFVFTPDFKPSIRPKNGYGGVGGSVIKPIGLSNVKHFKELLPDKTIIGCGGITTIRDACEYLGVGASLVQIGTQLIKTGPRLFEEFLLFN